MRRFAMAPGVMTVQHSKKLAEVLHAERLEQELSEAIAYCKDAATQQDWMTAVGIAAGVASPKEVLRKLGVGVDGTAYSADEVKFGGALGFLDLEDRAKEMSEMDVGRMRWACETLDETHKFSKILGDIAVRAEFASTDMWQPGALRRVDGDPAIDVVCLSLFWHKVSDESDHPLRNLCRDLIFCAARVGQGMELEVERFKRKVDEEKKRDVMGQSAWRYALDMKGMIKKAECIRDGKSDVELIAQILATNTSLANDWKADTCSRYLQVGSKISTKSKKILARWELAFQRNTLLDGITLLRSAATACPSQEEFDTLVETLYFEQVCKLRRSIAPKGRGHATDATNTMRGILLRQHFYAYVKQIFPKLAMAIENYGTWRWFHDEYNMTETGRMDKTLPNDSDEDPDTPGKGICPSPKDPSRFASKEKLGKLCQMVAKGRHDFAFASLGKAQGHANSMDLSAEPMRTLKGKVQEIWTDYIAEFPPDAVPTNVPGAKVDAAAQSSGHDIVEIRASARIESEHEYQMGLAQWGKQCEVAVESSTNDYIDAMIVIVVCEHETAPIVHRLKKVPFMNEPGRKLFCYDSLCREPVDWSAIKRLKRSIYGCAKVSMCLTSAGDESGDTLAVLKDVYMAFATQRASDHLSEDITACIVPGRQGDNPTNEVLNTAWKSLKGLGNRHQGPKIGNIRLSQEDVLSQMYTRGLWNPSPEYHMLFTFQASPSDHSGRKRMRHLKDNTRCGDTIFNEWPVPMYQPTQMPRVSMDEHAKMFIADTAIDDGAEDGAGTAMIQDLGDNVIPFPRETHVKFMQEVIHVFGIEAAVLFWVGSGQSLLAFVLERKRAVAVVRNGHEKKFVKANLVRAVKTLGLAPDRRPPKPAELVAWETHRAVSGALPKPLPPAPAAGGAPSVFTMPAPAAAPSSALAAGGAPSVFTVSTSAAAPSSAPAASLSPAPAATPPPPAALAAFGASTLR